MKTWFKRILIGLVVVVVVAVVGLAIFLLTFDPNAYKYKLAEMVQERYQRTLTIDGDIELSLFPRIGLSVQGVSLSEPASPETFASVDSMRLAVAVWPLLSNSFVVDHVSVNGFKARVVRDKTGRFNFDDLTHGQAPQVDARPGNAAQATAGAIGGAAKALVTGTAATPSDMQIDIAGLDLKDGELQLQDAITGMAVAVTRLNANTGRVTFNQAIDVSLSANVEGGNPRMDANLTGRAQLTLDPVGQRYGAQKLDLRLEGIVPGAQAKNLSARGNVAYDGRTASLDISALEMLFAGEITDPALPMTAVEASVAMPKLAIDPHKRALQMDRVAVRLKGTRQGGPLEFAMDAPALNISPVSASGQALTGRLRTQELDASFGFTGIGGNALELDIDEAKVDGTFKRGDRVVKTAFASPLSLDLLARTGGLSALKGDVNITDPGLPKGSLQIPVIGSVSADLRKDLATARINAVLEGGKFDLAADVSQLSEVPSVKFALAVDTLDLDKLAPPIMAAPPSRPEGGAAQPGKPAQPAGSTPADDGTIDLSALVGPSANGTVKIGQLVVRGLKASEVSAQMKLAKGRLDIASIAAALYGGKLAGVMSVDAADGNATAAKLTLAGIAIQPLLVDLAGKDTLSGTGSVALDIKTAGANTYAMTNALAGSMQLRLRDGAIKGINVAQTLREFKARLAGKGQDAAQQSDQSRQTDFTSLEADLVFDKGVATAKRLSLAAPLLRVSEGDPARIDFPRSALDFVAMVRVVNTSTGQDGKELEALKDITVPVHVTGPFDKPVYTVRWTDVASEALKRGLADRLRNVLGGSSDGGGSHNLENALKGLLGK
ncbi:AsmA family protein [Bordetella sp. 2513F-2]